MEQADRVNTLVEDVVEDREDIHRVNKSKTLPVGDAADFDAFRLTDKTFVGKNSIKDVAACFDDRVIDPRSLLNLFKHFHCLPVLTVFLEAADQEL